MSSDNQNATTHRDSTLSSAPQTSRDRTGPVGGRTAVPSAESCSSLGPDTFNAAENKRRPSLTRRYSESFSVALSAAHERITGFPEYSPELVGFLRSDTVSCGILRRFLFLEGFTYYRDSILKIPHPKLYLTAFTACFSSLICLVTFAIPISGPIDLPVWQWLPVLFFILLQCTFSLAPWANTFLSDVWGDRRVWKYFKIGCMASVIQLFFLGVIPAFTPYYPLPWMPVLGGLTPIAIGMIYYDLPRDRRSAASRKEFVMMIITIGSGIFTFAVGSPLLYHFSSSSVGLVKMLVFLSFYISRRVFEIAAKHYARLYCIDCYPLISLFAMYAYEFFTASVISSVRQIWLAFLLIALDLAENLYYIYCSYIVRPSAPKSNKVCQGPVEVGDIDAKSMDNDSMGQPEDADRTQLPFTIVELPSSSSYEAMQLDETGVIDYGCHYAERSEDAIQGNDEGHPMGSSLNASHALGQLESDVFWERPRRPTRTHSACDINDPGFSRIQPPAYGSIGVNPEVGTGSNILDPQQQVPAEFLRTADRRRRARRTSTMSTSYSFTDVLRQQTISVSPEKELITNDCAKSQSGEKYRKDDLDGVVEDLDANMTSEEISEDGEPARRPLSIMSIAICKEAMEILAPIHYLICFVVLRSVNPKLHDTFWDMTDEEFMRGIRRLLVDIVAEVGVFMLLVVAMKRWYQESIISIFLRLMYRFFWPFISVQVALMSFYIVLQYSNAGMTVPFDFKWIGQENVTWHGGNCYTVGNETIDEVC